ncbi:hypothetical protein ACFQ60_09730 [Streptomyces zhihengii]
MSTDGDAPVADTRHPEGCALVVVGADDTILACTAEALALIGEPAGALTGRRAGDLFADPGVWPRLRAGASGPCPSPRARCSTAGRSPCSAPCCPSRARATRTPCCAWYRPAPSPAASRTRR